MTHIIVSDIFGRTPALEEIAANLSGSWEIFDPYNSLYMGFGNESEAYTYFTSEHGLESYAEKLWQFLSSYKEQVSLIGFSVGAAAIWKISHQQELHNISHAICFYGSQIRHHIEVSPLFPIRLIFPLTENHFSVENLIIALSNKNSTTVEQAPYLHGFMNSHSKNFNRTGYSTFLKILSS